MTANRGNQRAFSAWVRSMCEPSTRPGQSPPAAPPAPPPAPHVAHPSPPKPPPPRQPPPQQPPPQQPYPQQPFPQQPPPPPPPPPPPVVRAPLQPDLFKYFVVVVGAAVLIAFAFAQMTVRLAAFLGPRAACLTPCLPSAAEDFTGSRCGEHLHAHEGFVHKLLGEP